MSNYKNMEKWIIELTEEDKENVRKEFGKTAKDVRKDCELIRDWMKQQAHFPDDYDINRIEYFLLRNKFRIERTKEKLENYYTVRAENIDFLKTMDPLSEKMKHFFTSISMSISTKLFNGSERVCFLRFNENAEAYCLEDNLLLIFAIAELEPLYDYASGMRVVLDFEHFNMTHLKKMSNIGLISKLVYIYQECLSGRFIAIHMVNAPSIFSLLLDVLKIAFPPKLYNKVIVHQNLDSLKEMIPEKYLPSEYGGSMLSYKEVYELFLTFMAKNKDYIMKRLQFIADETKRVGEVRKNDLFGIEGTFKKINID